MRRAYVTIITLSLLVGMMVGCSPNGASSNQTAEPSPTEQTTATDASSGDAQKTDAQATDTPKEAVELTLMGGANLTTVTEIAMRGFQENNPDIHINYEKYSYAEYPTKMKVQLSSGEATPDILLVHDLFTPQFVKSGWLMDLTDMIPMDDVMPLMRHVTKDGRIYGLPNQSSAIYSFFYRQDLYDEMGFVPPTTFEEYYDQGVALKEKGYFVGAFDPSIGGQGGSYEIFEGFLFNCGGRIFDDDGNVVFDKGVQALEMLKKCFDAGILHRSRQTNSTEYWTAFNEGQIAAFLAFSPEAAKYEANVDPAGKGGYGQLRRVNPPKYTPETPNACIINMEYFTINAKTAHPEEAKRVLTYLTLSEEGTLAFGNIKEEGTVDKFANGYIPGLKRLAAGETEGWPVLGGQKLVTDLAGIMLKEELKLPYKDERINEAETIMSEVLGEMFMNDRFTPQQAVDEMIRRIGAI